MAEPPIRTESAPRRRMRALLIAVLGAAVVSGGCAGRHRGPRTLATIGGAIALGGGVAWVVGERNDDRTSLSVGVVSVAVGIAAVVAAGGWMASAVACQADPDCPDDEQCKEIPAPPGGIPYKHCMPR